MNTAATPYFTAFVALIALSACGDPNDRCPDGVYDRTVVLTDDGFLFKQEASLFSSGEDETVPYSASPFLNCRVIGGIVMQSAGAVLDSEHYPLVEELGGITIEPLDNGGDRIVDELSGFDDVVRFGGMGNPWNLERAASVREISGFNNVEVVDGSLEVTAILPAPTPTTCRPNSKPSATTNFATASPGSPPLPPT